MGKYIWDWLRLAFVPSQRGARVVAGLITIFQVPAVAVSEWMKGQFPDIRPALESVPPWLVTLPFWAFVGFFGARLLLTPYWLHRRVTVELIEAKRQLDELRNTQGVPEALGDFLARMNNLLGRCKKDPETAADDLKEVDRVLTQEIEAFLKARMGPQYVALYHSEAGLIAPSAETTFHSNIQRKIHLRLSFRAQRLSEFLKSA